MQNLNEGLNIGFLFKLWGDWSFDSIFNMIFSHIASLNIVTHKSEKSRPSEQSASLIRSKLEHLECCFGAVWEEG